MEHGSIEREIHVDAPPEVVFEVVSRPEHIREWWPDEASFEPTAGAAGEIRFGDGATGKVEALTVVAVEPPRLFSFRWVYEDGAMPTRDSSLLVTFELFEVDGGTTVRLTETGFRERGWEVAQLEAAYQDHVRGWDFFVPRLGEYVARLVATS
ncbi:SRPBCC family protein [Nocardioides sp. URHA0020]|uniref:SRPBCC family protein n=1 Tax=Nocardioides sp. URHA0020 TaxID=1380392 RepID=UPI00048E8045|nr:SRPBCC family protein [Nocardioides sp. URHA0020]